LTPDLILKAEMHQIRFQLGKLTGLPHTPYLDFRGEGRERGRTEKGRGGVKRKDKGKGGTNWIEEGKGRETRPPN